MTTSARNVPHNKGPSIIIVLLIVMYWAAAPTSPWDMRKEVMRGPVMLLSNALLNVLKLIKQFKTISHYVVVCDE
jgi:hypothetical protein